jgi:hypothetical protein
MFRRDGLWAKDRLRYEQNAISSGASFRFENSSTHVKSKTGRDIFV